MVRTRTRPWWLMEAPEYLQNSGINDLSFPVLFSNFMRQECLDSRFVFDRPLPASRLVTLIGSSILLGGFKCLVYFFKLHVKVLFSTETLP